MGKSINIELLICPNCKSKIVQKSNNTIFCIQCKEEFRYSVKTPIFSKFSNENITDGMDKIKSLFKKWHFLYDLMIKVISPVFLQLKLKKFIKQYINKDVLAINLGSGNSDLSENIINADIFHYHNVNLCCDIEKIPIADSSVDVVINIAVLEHVKNPEIVVNEIYRILKEGGIVFTYFPFIQPFHASPYDFTRRTVEGLKVLHKQFQIVDTYNGAGPTSGFLWIFQEWISLILSFGIKKLHNYIYLLIMVLTFPIKYLDIILSKYSASPNISSGFVLIAKKNDSI
jgi:SAM-dependent methyltransferase